MLFCTPKCAIQILNYLFTIRLKSDSATEDSENNFDASCNRKHMERKVCLNEFVGYTKCLPMFLTRFQHYEMVMICRCIVRQDNP